MADRGPIDWSAKDREAVLAQCCCQAGTWPECALLFHQRTGILISDNAVRLKAERLKLKLGAGRSEGAVVAEAVTLGYPGFIEAHTADLGRWEEPADWQLQMARALGASVWTDAAIITEPGSKPVQHFRLCLSMIRRGSVLEARHTLLKELPSVFEEVGRGSV